jgi:hypothetical protein
MHAKQRRPTAQDLVKEDEGPAGCGLELHEKQIVSWQADTAKPAGVLPVAAGLRHHAGELVGGRGTVI